MVLMNAGATAEQVEEVMAQIATHKMQALRLPGDEHVAIGVASAIPPDLREPLYQKITSLPGVDHVVHISRPYKLASREFHPTDTIVRIKDVEIGGNACVVMAGPCSIESREQIYAAFKRGDIKRLIVSKVANFSIDLPDANVAIQVSGTFGSRQEEAQRLGRILRPKSDGSMAHFYSLVTRETRDQEFSTHRQLFLTEQGYRYEIIDAEALLQNV